jgi:Arc/MetJ-type ribon-helix-helix transcriptional regulator
MQQLVTRVDDRLAAAVDELVARGTVASRSDAVRQALVAFLDYERRKAIGEEIAASYAARPQSEDEIAWADAATVQMIAEEPW